MDERFLFRVWDNIKNQYIDKGLMHRNGYIVMPTTKNDFDLSKAKCDCVIEQCTGLFDMNGQFIYEGDVVKQFNIRGRLLRVGYIVYCPEEMKFKIREERCPDWNEKTDDFSFHPLKQRLLVIGNIHEPWED